MTQYNDHSVIERVERPTPEDHGVIEHVEHAPAKPHPEYEGADLSELELHIAESTGEELPDVCFECARPTKKHTLSQAFKCQRAAEKRLAERALAGDVEPDFDLDADWYMVQTVKGHEEKAKRSLEARLFATDTEGEVVYKQAFPGYILIRCKLTDALVRLVRQVTDVSGFVGATGSWPTPVPRGDVEKMLATVDAPAAPREPRAVDREVIKPTSIITPPSSSFTSPSPAAVPVNGNGEIDYEEIARAMRSVIEKERDEVVKRGGPLEKQNLDLKERLAEQVEQTQLWRTRHHAAVRERNSYKEQLDDQIKINRKLRNDYKLKKQGDHVRLVELEDILRVIDKAQGWSREMGGNGHWQIYKNGVWVSDAASSGGTTRVNMATRTKLRKAGLEV